MSTGLWVTLRYRDADQGIAWLRAVGFSERAVYRSDSEADVVEHAELDWPGGGSVMLGTYRPGVTHWPVEPGSGSAYVVTDDVDAAYAAGIAAGGRSVREPQEETYGGRGAILADPEGNLWSFGTYRGTER